MRTAAVRSAGGGSDRAQPIRSTRREALDGASVMLPLLLGYTPFAVTIGTTAAANDAAFAGWAGSWLVYGGSAQLVLLKGVAAGTTVVAVFTALLMHARLTMYGASLRSHWATQPRWFRLVAAALLIDPTWVVAEQRAGSPGSDADRRAHFLGAALTLGVGWSAAMGVGVLVGRASGDSLGLEVAVPLCLIGLVGPRLASRDSRPVVVAAAAVAALLHGSPVALLAAVAAGTAAGSWRRR